MLFNLDAKSQINMHKNKHKKTCTKKKPQPKKKLTIRYTPKSTKIYRNKIFPCPILASREKDSSFYYCSFKKGVTVMPSTPAAHYFYKCYFEEGAVVEFQQSRHIHFNSCDIEPGVVIDLDCSFDLLVEHTVVPDGVFKGYVREKVTYYRMSSKDPIPDLPSSMVMTVWDGFSDCDDDWEILTPFSFPKRPYVYYYSASFNSFDMIAYMLWRYPWVLLGYNNVTDFMLMESHHDRRKIAIMLALLSVLPVDLVREEVVRFLM